MLFFVHTRDQMHPTYHEFVTALFDRQGYGYCPFGGGAYLVDIGRKEMTAESLYDKIEGCCPERYQRRTQVVKLEGVAGYYGQFGDRADWIDRILKKQREQKQQQARDTVRTPTEKEFEI